MSILASQAVIALIEVLILAVCLAWLSNIVLSEFPIHISMVTHQRIRNFKVEFPYVVVAPLHFGKGLQSLEFSCFDVGIGVSVRVAVVVLTLQIRLSS